LRGGSFLDEFRMCGMENLCCWLVEAPDEMREIYADYTDFLLGMLDLAVAKGCAFDGIWFFADMAFHSGPMFSMVTFREVVAPAFRRVREWCTRHGKWYFLHTDGNLNLLMPELIAVGFDLVQPLEARAGNDVRAYKALYGDRVTFMGNINADVLARGDRAEVEDEIASKISVAKQGGGYIYNIDHSVPPTISFDVYRQAMAWIRKYGQYD
jgi:uroporphyrinogen decarboxylase